MGKTIDDLIEQSKDSLHQEGYIDPDELRKLLADSIQNCNECANLQLGVLTKGDICQKCQRIIDLMPSMEELLEKDSLKKSRGKLKQRRKQLPHFNSERKRIIAKRVIKDFFLHSPEACRNRTLKRQVGEKQ